MLKEEIKPLIENSPDPKKNQKYFQRFLGFFLFLFLLGFSFYLGYERGKSDSTSLRFLEESNGENNIDKELDFSLFWKAWDTLQEKYIDEESLNNEDLLFGAIRGMMKASGDPYTSFLDPEETENLSEQIGGEFEGIGAEMGIKDDILTIIAPLDESPAQKAGLEAGDKVLKIDDKLTNDLTLDEAVDLIRGKKGSQVALTIIREGNNETREITVTRDLIKIKSSELEFKENNIAYVRIREFGEQTGKEMRSTANEIIKKESPGIILDLRNNPGGLLDKSVEIASLMLPRGDVVVIEETSDGNRKEIKSFGGDKLSQIKTIVLINEGSASASEILAGALRDNRNNVTLLGEKSFGKGSVQELVSLPQKTSAKITVAKWLTPNGHSIMDEGISPDIEVSYTLEDLENQRDPQLEKALEMLK